LSFSVTGEGPDVGGIYCFVKLVVGPLSFCSNYHVFKVEGHGTSCITSSSSSCEHVCHTACIIPPPCSVWVWDPFGLQGASAGLLDCVVESLEGCLDHDGRGKCWGHTLLVKWLGAIRGSVWQA
jgi:hypothetical protein